MLSSFTIFDIVLDRLRLGKMGTSSHFLSAFTIFAQNRLWLGSPRANSDCYPIIKIWKKGVRLDCEYSLRYRSKYRNNTMKQDKLKATARLLEIMDTLREQCPWDRKQTFETLRNNTIEETYELADAILNKDLDGIKEEAGDLLLHVVFYAKLGEEAKVAVRNVRRDAMDKAKAMKKAGELTEDTQKTMEEEVQKLTDKYIKNIDAAVEEKQKEIMSV